MTPLLYDELVPWYRLLDPPEDHAGEAKSYLDALSGALPASAQTLLELGAGAGHNALYLKRRFCSTLTDLSPAMQRLSRELNPECEHVVGDMRTLRLDRSFDAVFVHDAICYMATPDDLLAALTTAFVHTRPGGVALFAPDHVAEGFVEQTNLHQSDAEGRSLRCMEWSWDPDPNDQMYTVEYAFLLRDAQGVSAVHDRHVEGLFARQTWLALVAQVGYQVELLARPTEEGPEPAFFDQMFLARRPPA
jgi:SAM-dependent methyltransferase